MMKKILFTDLDRTLFNSRSEISQRNYDSLVKLGEEGVVRVIVTGRNIHSAKKVLPEEFPLDYLVISSGAGVIDFKNKKILAKWEIDSQLVNEVISFLTAIDVDFMVHAPIPDNHHFEYFQSSNPCPDTLRRIEFNADFATPYQGEYLQNASQLLSIVEADKEHIIEHAIESLPDLSIIRATSPLDHESIWIEIFPAGVDKGYACRKVIGKLGFTPDEAVAIGNDYNDIAMLESFTDSYVVANAPQLMKNKYKTVKSDDEDGFTEMLKQHFDFIS